MSKDQKSGELLKEGVVKSALLPNGPGYYSVHSVTVKIRDIAAVERAYADYSLDIGEYFVFRGQASPDSDFLSVALFDSSGSPLLGGFGSPLPTGPNAWQFDLPQSVFPGPGKTYFVSFSRDVAGAINSAAAIVRVRIK